MGKLYNMIVTVLERPELYIGRCSVQRLYAFINGYLYENLEEQQAAVKVTIDPNHVRNGKNDPNIHIEDSWIAEWEGHNWCYFILNWTPLGDRAKHVDLDEEEMIPWHWVW